MSLPHGVRTPLSTATAAPATENITADDQIAGYHLKYYEIIYAMSVARIQLRNK
jgi:hypothetical protein